MRLVTLSVISLLFTLPAWGQSAASQIPQGATVPEAGIHYIVLEPQPASRPSTDKVEVLEFFGYKCSACNALEPYLAAWREQQPDEVEFAVIPVAWSPVWREYARLYYILKALGRENLHQEVFDTVHQRKHPLVTKDPEESFRLQLAFAEAHGIKAEDFTRTYHSAAIDTDIERAMDAARYYKAENIPTVVVARRYLTNFKMAGSEQQLIAIVKYLAATERRQRSHRE